MLRDARGPYLTAFRFHEDGDSAVQGTSESGIPCSCCTRETSYVVCLPFHLSFFFADKYPSVMNAPPKAYMEKIKEKLRSLSA